MDSKFLVVEIDSNEQAIQLVQLMLKAGFGRLMLLDDLVKHPALGNRIKSENTRDAATSPKPGDEEQPQEQKVPFPTLSQVSNPHVTSTVIKQEVNTTVVEDDEAGEEEEEDVPSSDRIRRGRKRSHEPDPDREDPDYSQQLMSLLAGKPEIVPIGVNSVKEDSERAEGNKKSANTGDYHECQLCGVRVKTPRSGRWNLQMHVIALHCVGRQYRCKECTYTDYRKSTMRKHCFSQHGRDIPPHNVSDFEMKKEFHDAMVRCFPEFAHRTGFLN